MFTAVQSNACGRKLNLFSWHLIKRNVSRNLFFYFWKDHHVSDDIRTRIETLMTKVKGPTIQQSCNKDQMDQDVENCKRKEPSEVVNFSGSHSVQVAQVWFVAFIKLSFALNICWSAMFHSSWSFENQDEICLERCSLHLSREFIM